MKPVLLNRAVTAAALVALTVTLGVWLTRAPLTAGPAVVPAPPPFKSVPQEALPQPTVAPPAPPAILTPAATTTEVQIEVEIAPSPDAPVVADPIPTVSALRPAAKSKPAATPPEQQPGSQPRRSRGLFRHRQAVS